LKSLRLILFLGLAACTSTSRQGESQADAPILGSWTWIETSGGKMGRASTSRDEGYTITATFGADGSFTFLKDGESWVAGTFATVEDDSGLRVQYVLESGPTTTAAIGWASIGDPPGHWVRFDETGALILDEGCCDRYQHIFRKGS